MEEGKVNKYYRSLKGTLFNPNNKQSPNIFLQKLEKRMKQYYQNIFISLTNKKKYINL